tara:strand:- start:3270 stop:4094 length:825 start_codon:yes stop_codon:yes gene_type:complete
MKSDEDHPRCDHDIERLLSIMARLRAPEGGCPWDVEQTFETIAPYTIEEAYEVADAIDRADMSDLRDELGDLLLQVIFHARMAQEAGHFDFSGVVASICDKMVARHPHVFGEAKIGSADEQTTNWETLKAAERENSNSHEIDVALGLPALMRAAKIGKRAARMGFDWPDSTGVLEKIEEELAELKEAAEIDTEYREERVTEEIGDFLFASANLARHYKIDPEEALRRANLKFQRRFKAMEARVVDSGSSLEAATLDELEAAWVATKRAERDISG